MKEKKIKEKKEKDQKENKFLQIIKKKWLINGTTTLALVLIIILVFIALNMWMQSLELTPIDLSQEKLYTLTDESKEKVKNIDKDINLYFVGYTDSDSTVDLAKQYKKVNEKINAEAVDATTRPDLVEKYGIESGSEGIIVECGDKSKVLTSSDLVTYDTTTYETISIAEQKLTSSIIAVATDKVPKVYFLEGYSDYKLSNNMTYLGIYLSNEVTEVDTLDVLSTGKIPDDCDTLIICTPKKDFDEIAANAIIDYINSGRNILWLNSAVTSEQNFPNVNKILALYGVKPFEIGIIRETDSSKMLQGSPDIIKPDALYSTITKDIAKDSGVRFINATKINLVSEEELENLKSCITIEENILERFKVSGELEKIISYIENKFETKAGININFSCKECDIKKARMSNDLHQIRISQILNGEDFPSALYVTSIYNDIIKLALAIFDINNHISDKKEKTKIKYQMALSMRSVEKELIRDNFEINPHPYMENGLLLIDDSEKFLSEMIKTTEVSNFFPVLADKLVELDNNVFYTPDKYHEAIFNSCLMRASFVIVSKNYGNLVKQKFEFLLEMLKKNVGQKIAYDLLYEAINSYDNDKDIPQFLSFGR